MHDDYQSDHEWDEPTVTDANARVKFWDCPEFPSEPGHPREPQRVRIQWDGDVATCLDCGRTNQAGVEKIGCTDPDCAFGIVERGLDRGDFNEGGV